MKSFSRLVFILVILSVLAAGCVATPAKPAEFRIALLPIMESLPIFVAQQAGYFEAQGVNVTIIPAGSAADRDQLMAAGQADGIINDLVSVVLYNREKTEIKVVRFMRTASATEPNFSIVASNDSGISTPTQLANIPIGISQASVIDYVTDRMLINEGLKDDQIKTVAVPKMADRLALLGSGELKAATLPEPFATLAISQGGVLVVNDTKYPDYGISVFSVRQTYLTEQPQGIKGFLAAIDQAVADINANPEKWKPLLEENKLIPPAVAGTIQMPMLPPAGVPSKAQFDDVVDWAIEQKLITNRQDYADSIQQ
ncbi:MAG: ABC transporter substrate-binding protein [Anaerolineaceae bacterium]